MNIKHAVTVLSILGFTTTAGAQNTDISPSHQGADLKSQGAVPEVPSASDGKGATTTTPMPNQTPPVQQDIIPSQSGSAETSDTRHQPVPGMQENQPTFQRDVVPLSTEPERSGGAVDQGQGNDESTVSPDTIPDRRFETFDSDVKGTPEMEKMPDKDESRGGTTGLPAGGYGIGGPGQ